MDMDREMIIVEMEGDKMAEAKPRYSGRQIEI